MKRSLGLLAPLLLLVACDAPDPEAEDPFRQLSKAPPPQAQPEGGPQGAAPGERPPPAGQPGEEGASAGHPPGEGGPPAGGEPGLVSFDPDSMVKISGTVSTGRFKGPVQVDFIHLDQPFLDGIRPMLNVVRLDKPGAFELTVPKGQGRIQVVTYLDLNEDGLGSGDTQAYWPESPLKVKDSDLKNLKIEIDPDDPQIPPPLEGVKREGKDLPTAKPPGEITLGEDGEPLAPPPDRAQPTPDPKKTGGEPVVGDDGEPPPPPEGREPEKKEGGTP